MAKEKIDTSLNRQRFVSAAAIASGVALMGSGQANASKMKLQESKMKLPPMHKETKPEVAMLIYPGVTLLDLIGPQSVLAPSCNVHVVWKNTDLLETDSEIVMKATSTLEECPKDLDVLFVPGGEFSIMRDEEVLRFLADRGSRARYVTSVCGGSIVLGAAGLLQGYEATSHWSARDKLPPFWCNASGGPSGARSQPHIRRRRNGRYRLWSCVVGGTAWRKRSENVAVGFGIRSSPSL